MARLGVLLMLLALMAGGQSEAAGPRSGWVTLAWTAPGDDSTRGAAALYDVRCSKRPITEAGFDSAMRVLVKRAQSAGNRERCRIGGLAPAIDYFFAIKSRDQDGNWSRISNLAVYRGRAITSEPPADSPTPDPPIPPPDLSAPFPNPARGPVRFALGLPRVGMSRVEVFDLSGRRVKTLVASIQPAGITRVDWDLRDERGNPICAGIYLVRAELGGVTRLRRLVVIR
jgi:hypothetical protein